MHELSIATSLVQLCLDAAADARETGRIEAVHVRVGALSGVVVDALEFAWDVAAAGTPCEGARLAVERVAGRVLCLDCGTETEVADPPRFRCGRCGGPAPGVVAGRDLDLVALEIEDASPTATPGVPT